MDNEQLKSEIEEAFNRAGHIDPGAMLAITILDELQARFPDFDQAIRERLLNHAKRLQEGEEDGDAERAQTILSFVKDLFPSAP